MTIITLPLTILDSTIGNDDRRTRTAYRNRMKRDAFELMRDISANLSIHKSVLSRAKEESEFILLTHLTSVDSRDFETSENMCTTTTLSLPHVSSLLTKK